MVSTIKIMAVVFIVIGIILMVVCMYFSDNNKNAWTHGLPTSLAGSAFINVGSYILLIFCSGKEIIYIDDTINRIIVAGLHILFITFLIAEAWIASLWIDTTPSKYMWVTNIGVFLAPFVTTIFFGATDFIMETLLLTIMIGNFSSLVLGVIFCVHLFIRFIKERRCPQ